MNCTLPQPILARGLAQATRAITASRQSLPITADVLLQAQAGWLALSATNLDLAVTVWLQADVTEEGAATVPGRLFSEVVAAQPDAPVRLAHGDEAHALVIACGRTRCAVRGHDPAEFPLLPQLDAAHGLPIPGDILRALIAQSAFAAADDDARPVLTGVLLTFDGARLTAVATDGFRIAVGARPLATALNAGWSAIIPARTLTEVARILPAEAPTVTLCVAENGTQILFHTDYVQLTSRLLVGEFVDYARIMPRTWSYRAIVNTAEWRQALRSVALFARQNNDVVRLVLLPAAGALGTLRVTAAAQDVGDNVCDVDAVIEVAARDTQPGVAATTPVEACRVAFNVTYIAEALAAIKAEQLALELTSASEPGVLRPLDGSEYHYLLMPLSLPEDVQVAA